MKRNYIKPIVVLCIFLAAAIGCTIWLWDYISALGTEQGRAELKAAISGLGFGGWLLTLGIQVLQILVAVLPGEPVELMLGFMWGPLWGTLTCLLGIFIGTLLIFIPVKIFGAPFVDRIIGDKDKRRYKFLSDPVKLELTVFVLFFIPGTPKDVLTYLVPLTGISPIKYFLIATFARLPSVVTSTVLGDSVIRGDYALSIAVFAVTALISVAGIICANKYISYRSQRAGEVSDGDDSEHGNKI